MNTIAVDVRLATAGEACFHCNERLPDNAPQLLIDGVARGFCCDGCAAAVGMWTVAWHSLSSSLVRPLASGPKTTATRPPPLRAGATCASSRGVKAGRSTRPDVAATNVASATASCRLGNSRARSRTSKAP